MAKKRIMRALKINEISGVDVPAQQGAKAVIMKRAESPEEFAKASALTTEVNGHTHLIALHGPPDGVEMNAGHTGYVDSHSHPWIRNANGDIIIGAARGMDGRAHTHEISIMSKTASDSGTIETDRSKAVADETEKTAQTVEDLTKKLEKANKIAALNDAEKAHYNTLDDAGKDEFLAKSADQRKEALETIEKAKTEADPVVYKTMDGIELRKSAGEALVAMAKSNDALRKQNDELVEKAANAEFEKRADAELSHTPGTVQERAAMLKAIEAIEDKGAREASLNALKAGNSAIKGAFSTVGVSRNPEVSTAEDSLESLAKAYQKDHSTLTYEQAYTEVLKTSEGRAAYAKSVGAN